MKVSAIIPTFRRPQLIARSLESVLAQTHRPLELIVIDDGSGDDTPRVLETFATRAKAANVDFKFFTVPNGGPGLARNVGMQQATGDLFAFLDDDDAWMPDKLATQVAALAAKPAAGVSFTQYVHAGSDVAKPSAESLRDGWCFKSLCEGNTRAHLQTLMVRREVTQRCGGFLPLYNFEDAEFALRASLDFEFVAVPRALTVIHGAPTSVSREAGLEGDLKRDAIKLKALEEFAAKYASHARFDGAALKNYRARIYDEHIKHLLWLGRVGEARDARHRALADCGDLAILRNLGGKIRKARALGWFGMRLKKP
ncbi:MAG: glycosyltransferase family 2 protein [Planctomycetes bacterium]|nr:glycosyltransferase family 2 protein [Planctomycetota bacterium]